MFPSFGSRSRPADVPHLRPAGNSPQFRVTFGAGFGRPSPVMGFPTFAACADSVARELEMAYAAVSASAQTPMVESRIRGAGMAPPRDRGIIALKACRFARFAGCTFAANLQAAERPNLLRQRVEQVHVRFHRAVQS